MASLEFTKMHGCGNDYIYIVALRARPADPAALSRRLSDRHLGVGGDGLIMLAPSRVGDFRMEMYNADGSRGDMCGNGIRCLARLAYERGFVRKNPMAIETDAGLKTVHLQVAKGEVRSATVDMGEPILDGRQIPVAADGRIIDYPLEVDGRTEKVTCVSMGNPHCIIFVDDTKISDHLVQSVGQWMQTHPAFPNRVNVEFVRVNRPDDITMRVWERGSGETLACGTGACAVAVAGVLTGRTQRRITAHLPGGDLQLHWSENDNHVYMTGPAVEVFSGDWPEK